MDTIFWNDFYRYIVHKLIFLWVDPRYAKSSQFFLYNTTHFSWTNKKDLGKCDVGRLPSAWKIISVLREWRCQPRSGIERPWYQPARCGTNNDQCVCVCVCYVWPTKQHTPTPPSPQQYNMNQTTQSTKANTNESSTVSFQSTKHNRNNNKEAFHKTEQNLVWWWMCTVRANHIHFTLTHS